MKRTLALIALLLASPALAVTEADPTPDPDPAPAAEAEPEATEPEHDAGDYMRSDGAGNWITGPMPLDCGRNQPVCNSKR